MRPSEMKGSKGKSSLVCLEGPKRYSIGTVSIQNTIGRFWRDLRLG